MSADYNITISSEPLAAIQSLLKDSNYNKILVLVDNNTLKHCYPLIGDGLTAHETVTIPLVSHLNRLKPAQPSGAI